MNFFQTETEDCSDWIYAQADQKLSRLQVPFCWANILCLSVSGVMIGLLVLAIGFQLSIKYTPEIKVTELNTTYSYCAKYK